MLYYGAMRNHCRERKWSDLGGFQMLVTVKILLQQRRQTRIMAPLQNDRLSSHNYHLYGIGNPKRRDNHSLMFLCISRRSVFPVDSLAGQGWGLQTTLLETPGTNVKMGFRSMEMMEERHLPISVERFWWTLSQWPCKSADGHWGKVCSKLQETSSGWLAGWCWVFLVHGADETIIENIGTLLMTSTGKLTLGAERTHLLSTVIH